MLLVLCTSLWVVGLQHHPRDGAGHREGGEVIQGSAKLTDAPAAEGR